MVDRIVDDLIIKILAGSASSFEEERLRRWRSEAPENEKYFQEMAQVWSLTAPEPVIPASDTPSVETILSAAPVILPTEATSRARSQRKGNPWATWGLLAASVAALGLGIGVVGRLAPGPDPAAVHHASAGETPTVTLRDGSFVRLAEGSTLREWELDDRREVSLEGRAFFAVSRDESRPFVIRTEGGEVTVLGTRFQIDTEGPEVETVVVEGLVRVSNHLGSVEVLEGNRARMKENEAPIVEAVDDALSLLEWSDGALLFQATPLSAAVAEVSRHYGRPIQILATDLENRRVTAWFQGEPFEAVAESLCVVTEASCRIEGDSVTMEWGGVERTGGTEGTR